MTIREGEPSPDLDLPDQDGKQVSLAAMRGRDVIVYFYPRDETPGCTKEACAFRDLFAEIQASRAQVIGVSPDGGASHRDFIAGHRLPFPLLSDPDKNVMAAWGAWGEKTSYGKTTTGVIRSTVWVGPDGTVKKHWARVGNAAEHPAEVLAALRSARA